MHKSNKSNGRTPISSKKRQKHTKVHSTSQTLHNKNKLYEIYLSDANKQYNKNIQPFHHLTKHFEHTNGTMGSNIDKNSHKQNNKYYLLVVVALDFFFF